jgi:hypothetical protein
MHSDIVQFALNCPEYTIVSGGGPAVYPLLHPIPVQRPFQIVGVDLPLTKRGNRHVLVCSRTIFQVAYGISNH